MTSTMRVHRCMETPEGLLLGCVAAGRNGVLCCACGDLGRFGAPARGSCFAFIWIHDPAIPTDVKVKPGMAAVTVSWHDHPKAGVTFSVTSVPAGQSCVVVGIPECTISDTSSTPWRYEVTASIGTAASAPPAVTQPVPHR